MIYGTPSLTIEDDQTDIVGLRHLLVSRMWQPSRWPMSLEELDAEAPEEPGSGGGMSLIGTQRRRQGGVLRSFWLYEGINGDGKTVTFKTRGNSPHYGFDPGFSERPIQLHPKIDDLLDKYEGQVIDNQIIWPLNLGDDGAGTSGLSRGNEWQHVTGNDRVGAAAASDVNPMFGRDSYLAFQGGTYFYRYMVANESEIPNIFGKIYGSGSLPGAAPRFGSRNWLGAGAQFLRRGPVAIEVVENYQLSDDGGWPKQIYGK